MLCVRNLCLVQVAEIFILCYSLKLQSRVHWWSWKKLEGKYLAFILIHIFTISSVLYFCNSKVFSVPSIFSLKNCLCYLDVQVCWQFLPPMWFLGRSLWLSDGCLLVTSSYGLSLMYPSGQSVSELWCLSLFSKDTHPVGLGSGPHAPL